LGKILSVISDIFKWLNQNKFGIAMAPVRAVVASIPGHGANLLKQLDEGMVRFEEEREAKRKQRRHPMIALPHEMQPHFTAIESARKEFQLALTGKDEFQEKQLRIQRQSYEELVAMRQLWQGMAGPKANQGGAGINLGPVINRLLNPFG